MRLPRSLIFAALACLVALNVERSAPAQQPAKTPCTQSIRLTEKAGIARQGEPVELTLRFDQDLLKDPAAIRLFRLGRVREGDGERTPVAFQVLEVASPPATDDFAPKPQTFVRIVLLADVDANASATYEVALDGPAASPAASISITGDGVGKAIDTGLAKFELHAASGQLLAFTPKEVSGDRLVFKQFADKPELPFHWNPDIWLTGGKWGHTSDWNAPSAFDAMRQKREELPAETADSRPFFFQPWSGPLVYRLSRFGRMPFVPGVDVSVTYSFYAGAPFVGVQSQMEFREGMSVHAVRNAELVFSRHQFDTAVWMERDGKLQTAPAYDYNEPDKSFGNIARLAADAPLLALVNERKVYGIAYVTRRIASLNPLTGDAADEGAQFYLRDYDEHGKGSPANFLYFVRPIVYREGYLPTFVAAGSTYSEQAAILVFKLHADPAKKYDDLLRWQRMLTNPLEVVVD